MWLGIPSPLRGQKARRSCVPHVSPRPPAQRVVMTAGGDENRGLRQCEEVPDAARAGSRGHPQAVLCKLHWAVEVLAN
jgi:hypothetical protein